MSIPGAGLHFCHSTALSPRAAVANQQHRLALLLSCREEGKGKGPRERLPLGHSPVPGARTERGVGKGKAPLPGSGRAAALPPLGAGQGEETRGANRVSITQVPALPCSPAPHTDMQHRNALLSTPGVHRPCTGSAAAGTLLLPRWLCPLCCPTGSATGSAVSSRKQAGAGCPSDRAPSGKGLGCIPAPGQLVGLV